MTRRNRRMAGLLCAVIGVVAVPVVVGAEPQAARRAQPSRRICEVHMAIGTRLGSTRVCRTKIERNQLKAEGRDVIERIQNQRGILGTK